jgi:transcriptional regulator with XRE-family HTH domain
MTQAELSTKVGCSRITLGRWESGERVPTTNDLQKLTTVLNTSASYLIGETNDPQRQGPAAPMGNNEAVKQGSSVTETDFLEECDTQRKDLKNIQMEYSDPQGRSIRMVLPRDISDKQLQAIITAIYGKDYTQEESKQSQPPANDLGNSGLERAM